MGQGTQSTCAALIAEEMDLAWHDLRIPPGSACYNHAMLAEAAPGPAYGTSAFQQAIGDAMGTLGKPLRMQVTGRSTAMKHGDVRMRAAGAAAREMLKADAARQLRLPLSDLTTHDRAVVAPDGTPVMTTWPRAEDMSQDFHRPAAVARMRGAVLDGQAVLLDASVAAPSTARQAPKRWLGIAPPGPDKVDDEGLWNQPYAIPNRRARGYIADLYVPVGFWRSVGNSYNGFFHESLVDEMARAAARDPLIFRLALTQRVWPPAAVLTAVREMSGWPDKPAGTGRGVAMCDSFGTPVAGVIEVAQTPAGVRITRTWMAADVGSALDPGILDQQLVGGLVYGLSAAMTGQITFSNGAAGQRNFPDADPLRMPRMPRVETRILQTRPRISGIGEPGTPPAAPALANALFDLTGTRQRRVPLAQDVAFA